MSRSKFSKIKDGLANLVTGLGTSKDKKSHTGWYARGRLDQQTLENMYVEDWLSGKIVDIIADDMTRKWRTLTAPSLDAEQLEQVAKLEDQLAVQHKINLGEKWGRLYGGALVLLGVDDGQEPDQPLDISRVGQGDLKFIHVVDRNIVSVGLVNTWDFTEPNYMMPEIYTIDNLRIHHSRVLRFDGIPVPREVFIRNDYWGSSILQRVYDAIINSQQVAEETASMTAEAKVDVIGIENLIGQIADCRESDIISRFSLANTMKSNRGMLILDKDYEHYEQKQLSFSALPQLIQQYLNIAAAAADVPATRLLGTSAPGLNATGAEERKNYHEMIESKQEVKLSPQMEKFDEILVRSALGFMPDDFSFFWNPLSTMSEVEKAQIELAKSQTAQNYINMTAVTPSIITEQLLSDETFAAIDQDYVDLVKQAELQEPIEEPEETENPGFTPEFGI